ncbi:MAG TPA: hypothetical protein PLO37_16685 [Candidatus Hydrogenedentes bacterium]|nr:hypothetical protein [Candidatus Hydrogenedentota bacterium]HPG68484.1 hypothetical protein [Candidatus Hydrogenedentota bacterium]
MNEKFLAFLCSICPFCISARHWPNSKFAQKLREAEKNCPACQAYQRLHAKKD